MAHDHGAAQRCPRVVAGASLIALAMLASGGVAHAGLRQGSALIASGAGSVILVADPVAPSAPPAQNPQVPGNDAREPIPEGGIVKPPATAPSMPAVIKPPTTGTMPVIKPPATGTMPVIPPSATNPGDSVVVPK